MNNKTFYNLVFKNKKKNWFFFSFHFFFKFNPLTLGLLCIRLHNLF
jgi:hypothetical protein